MIPAAISEYLDRHHAQWSLLGHPAAYTASPEELHALEIGASRRDVLLLLAELQDGIQR